MPMPSYDQQTERPKSDVFQQGLLRLTAAALADKSLLWVSLLGGIGIWSFAIGHPDVLRLVAPTFAANPRVTIVEGDAFTHPLKRGERFGAVWHDIWDFICADNLEQMRQLRRRYCRRADWQGCWAFYETMRAAR